MENQVRKISFSQHAVILLFVAIGIALVVKDFQVRTQAVKEPEIVQARVAASSRPIPPIPLSIEVDERKVLLGEKLYHDTRLSGDDTISCATCHDLKKGGTDQMKVSKGFKGALGPINSPTTFNSGFFFSQFWDGRAKDLVEQAGGPVHNPEEMGSNWAEVVQKLSKDPYYVQAFAEIYGNGINGDNIADAIAEFEKSLITPNSRFDRFLRGDEHALAFEEKEGYRLFKEIGCISCHQGVALGGNMYQTLGTMEDYFIHREKTEVDYGRYNVTKKEWNLYQFKVPTLRNIELTHPYLHDGSAETIEDVLQVMWKSQLGRSISREESARIVQFLKTLTGTYKGEPLQ